MSGWFPSAVSCRELGHSQYNVNIIKSHQYDVQAGQYDVQAGQYDVQFREVSLFSLIKSGMIFGETAVGLDDLDGP